MLVNQKQKINKKTAYILIAFILLVTTLPISALAAYSTARLDGSSTSAKTITIDGWFGSTFFETANTGANTTVRGYAKRVVPILPDSIEASTPWLNPGQYIEETRFELARDKQFYAQISGQTKSSRGYVSLKY